MRDPTMLRPTAQDALTEEELDRLLASPIPAAQRGRGTSHYCWSWRILAFG
jgi:hypothetical protein